MVKQGEYTKGEWKSRHPTNNDYLIYTGEYGEGITQVAMLSESSPDAEANSHLIASSPMMYEALKLSLDETLYKPLQDDIKKIMKQALAKAEGKEG